jgi:hypothetical protein
MKKYVLAAGIALGAVFVLSAQAAPLATNATAIQAQVAQDGAVAKVQHWRWGSHHRHWRRHGGHWRWGSGGHYRWGSGGHYRWGSYGWHGRHRSHWGRRW